MISGVRISCIARSIFKTRLTRYAHNILTSGRGLYSSEVDHYQEIPHEMALKIIDSLQGNH